MKSILLNFIRTDKTYEDRVLVTLYSKKNKIVVRGYLNSDKNTEEIILVETPRGIFKYFLVTDPNKCELYDPSHIYNITTLDDLVLKNSENYYIFDMMKTAIKAWYSKDFLLRDK